MAVDITAEVAASHPVIDELPANMPVSVENSAIVYDHGNGRVQHHRLQLVRRRRPQPRKARQ